MLDETISVVLGLFRVYDSENGFWPGNLQFGPKPTLQLLIRCDTFNSRPAQLLPLKEGAHLDLTGISKDMDWITLISCVETESTFSINSNILRLTLVPTEIWRGPKPLQIHGIYKRMRLDFRGIHSIIGSDPVSLDEDKITYDAKLASEFILQNDNPFIKFRTYCYSSFSHFDGISTSAINSCIVTFQEKSRWDTFRDICIEVESFLSFICMKSIIHEQLILEDDDNAEFALLWYLGLYGNRVKIWAHESLGTFRDDLVEMQRAWQRWSMHSVEEKLARSLYLDSQDKREVSVGRFFSLCKSIEIVGRQFARTNSFDKQKLSTSASNAARLICRELGYEYENDEGYYDKFRQHILRVSNPSFREIVMEFLTRIPDDLKSVCVDDETKFVTTLVKFRNAVVHMQNVEIVYTDRCIHLADMIYKLLNVFLAYQAIAIGLRPERVIKALN